MARRKKRTLTENQKLYQKEYNRISDVIRRAKKRGFFFPEGSTPSSVSNLIKQGKRVTKELLTYMQELRGDLVYQNAYYVSPTTGQVITGEEGRALERHKASVKSAETRKHKNRDIPEEELPKETDLVLQKIEHFIFEFISTLEVFTDNRKNSPWVRANNWLASEGKNLLTNGYNKRLAKVGRDEFAKGVQNSGADVDEAIDGIMRESTQEGKSHYVNQLLAIIFGRPLTAYEQRVFSQLSEYDEDYSLYDEDGEEY